MPAPTYWAAFGLNRAMSGAAVAEDRGDELVVIVRLVVAVPADRDPGFAPERRTILSN